MPHERLAERTTIQGHDVTLLKAIFHVVEHFSGHTAQIIFITKMLTGEDLGFYAYLSKPQPHAGKHCLDGDTLRLFRVAVGAVAARRTQCAMNCDSPTRRITKPKSARRFRACAGRVLEVVMSRSSPGRYALHEFAKNIYNVRATDGAGKRLQVTRPNPYQWNVETIRAAGSTVVVDYTLFGDRADGTYDAIDPSHAHLNPPATFAWARGFEKSPVSLKIEIPARLGLDRRHATGAGAKAETWTAPNLDALMDAPLEIGPHVLREWNADGAQFRLALHSQAADDVVTRFQKMCEAVVLEEEGVFGAFPKYDNGSYTFLVDYLPYVSGDGMEHRDSTVITSARALTQESAGQLIESVAHEFFHSWNVKRIRPRSLEPFDYERVNMSGELWFAEGFTDYYAPLVLNRAGLMSRDEFLRVMGNAVDTVLTAPGHEVFSPVDMSRRAAFVDGAASIDPQNQANTYISYYTYGRAIALGIDLAIRSQFPGQVAG